MGAHRAGLKPGAFQAAARPLCSGVACRARNGALPVSAIPERPTLAELIEGPYLVLSKLLDAAALCRTDASCRSLKVLNGAHVGAWRALGTCLFHGLELERDGIFEQPACGAGKHPRIDWKARFRHFRTEVPTLCVPFGGPEITTVAHPDEVAYFRCRLCTDVLGDASAHGVYLEVEVMANPDNLSMAVVDFEAGGCSSVTFSPDTGAVIRERKVREAPRKVEGAYIQPLPTVPPGRRFHGLMGLYLYKGHLAFYRRCATGPFGDSSTSELGPWETTGFISDLGWAEGCRLTPCLAFRDEGMYRVRVASVSANAPFAPPLAPPPGHRNHDADGEEERGWSGFDWEVGPPVLPDVS